MDGRLTGVDKNGARVTTVTYDGNGNRLSHTDVGGTVAVDCDSQDRLISHGRVMYTYAANGELETRTQGAEVTTFSYDELGSLMTVTLPSGVEIEYVVDGHGRDVGKSVDGVPGQGFLYRDNINPIVELDGAGNILSRFV